MRSLTERGARLLGRSLVHGVQRVRAGFYRVASVGTRVTGRPNRQQPVYCVGRGQVVFGENFQAGYLLGPDYLTSCCYLNPREPTAIISFGRDVTLNNGFTAIAESCRIALGDRVLVGPSVSIYDSDFHGLVVGDRSNSAAVRRGDVTIEDDVFIGSHVTILKGVTVGRCAVVAAGAVVASDVPANTIVAGSPARVIKSI